VAYRLTGPVTTFVREGPQPDSDIDAADMKKIFRWTALLEAVVADLGPALSDAELVIEQFAADGGKWTRWWAEFVTDDAWDSGRATTSFSRLYAGRLLLRLAREVAVPEEDVPALSEAIRAWARFTNADWADELPELLEGYAILNARVSSS
jgi:hypothetical protein